MRKLLLISALMTAAVAAPVAAQQAVTPDDCRAEFQANLIRQGGYAPEKLARSGAPGTAEYYYNRCLARVEGRAGGYDRVVTNKRGKVVQPLVSRDPCSLEVVGGVAYRCVRQFGRG